MADATGDLDPYGSYYFALTLAENGGADVEVAHFVEGSGIKSSATVFEIEEGGLNGRTHKRPGQSKWENLTLRYATDASTHILKWRDAFIRDDFSQRIQWAAKIQMKNNAGDVLRTFNFSNAWPVSWEGPQFKSEGSSLSIESVEVAFDDVTIS